MKIYDEEGQDIWDSAKITVLGYYTGSDLEPLILLSSFNAG